MSSPKSNRFQKGKSGNPKGRPTGSQSWDTLINRALKERVEIEEKGETRKLYMAELIMKGLIRECLSGNPSAIDLLLSYFQRAHSEKLVFRLNMGKDLSAIHKKNKSARQ